MPDNSFDVVSVVDMPEVLNAIQQARKEAQTRFDLKDSKSQIDLNEKDKKIDRARTKAEQIKPGSTLPRGKKKVAGL